MKSRTRQILLDQVRDHFSGPIKYIGLPGASVAFEEQLATTDDLVVIQMDGYEMDSKVVSIIESKLTEREIPLSIHEGNIHDTIESFNLAWFDYCGCLDPAKLEALAKVVTGTLYQNGTDDPLIGITLLRGREKRSVWPILRPGEDIPLTARKAKSTPAEPLRKFKWWMLRHLYFPHFLNQKAGEVGRHFSVTRFIEYHESSPMLLLIGRIGEGKKPLAICEGETLE